MRLRSLLTEVTMYQAGCAEEEHLDHALQPVLSNQLRLVMWRWLLSACTTGLEYAGALLNYTCLGLVVFTGKSCAVQLYSYQVQQHALWQHTHMQHSTRPEALMYLQCRFAHSTHVLNFIASHVASRAMVKCLRVFKAWLPFAGMHTPCLQ